MDHHNHIEVVIQELNIFDLVNVLPDLSQSFICVKSLSVKIDTLASVGMSILMPEIPVTTVLSQSMCIVLKQHQLVFMQTFSFGICCDNLIDVG